jgi:hypothetical protein
MPSSLAISILISRHPVAGPASEATHRRPTRLVLCVAVPLLTRQRLPEHAEVIGHANAKMNGESRRRYERFAIRVERPRRASPKTVAEGWVDAPGCRWRLHAHQATRTGKGHERHPRA